METGFGNIGLNSGKLSLKVMFLILTSKCSHIIDITGRSEDIRKTVMASDGSVGLKGKLHTVHVTGNRKQRMGE